MTETALEHTCSLKRRSVERWAAHQLGGVRHERCVARLAVQLFIATGPLHRLTADHRRLLRLAAFVHDVGRKIDDRTHPAQGARMILQDRRLTLAARERRVLAYLTRYHRGAVPKLGFDGFLIKGDGRSSLRLVLALLRAADGLDGRQLSPADVSMKLAGRKLSIEVGLDDASPRAKKFFKRRKKFRLLEELLDLKIDVRVHVTVA